MRYLSVFLVALCLVFAFNAYASNRITVHYHRPDGDYDDWNIWTWGVETGNDNPIHPVGKDDYGLIFEIDLNEFGNPQNIGMLPRLGVWLHKDDPNRFFNVSLGDKVYIMQEDKNVYATKPDISPRVVSSLMDSETDFRIILSKSLERVNFSASDIVFKNKEGERHNVVSVEPVTIDNRIRVLRAQLDENDAFTVGGYVTGTVSLPGYREGRLEPGDIVYHEYYYSDVELGAIYSPEQTTFRVFAPTALEVYINLYERHEGGEPDPQKMKYIGNGVWEVSVNRDLLNTYYKVLTKFYGGVEYEGMDPYSRSNTAHDGRCLIFVDNTPITPAPVFPQTDAIIYEVHIRDLNIDPHSNVLNRGKYLGMTEYPTYLICKNSPDGTNFDQSIRTNLAHIVDLGVNVVQLLPIQDFDHDESGQVYNWGYMPYHFNSPDGWYASRTDDASRVRETKKMIDAFHRKGIKVVMDVVYNHTAEGNPEIRVGFNAIAPNYYYRVREDGSYWNGSGCGNEFKSESPMGRRFIIDSLKYWVTEFDVSGFRFDLMGLIDLETMKLLTDELREIKPDILIYGEPWVAAATPISPTVKGTQRNLNFGVFNDHFRDALKGSTFDDEVPGYIQTGINIDRIKSGIIASITDFAAEPIETINYIEAHDNHTVWDKFQLSAPDAGDAEWRKMTKLGAAVILTSQGIPFIHGGQDFARTKYFEHNSYNAPDSVNMFDWRRKLEYLDVFEYFQNLIQLRHNHPMFRFDSADQIRENIYFLDDDIGMSLPDKVVAYVINKGNTNDPWENALVAFNPNSSAVNMNLPDGNWKIAVRETGFYGTSGQTVSSSVQIPARSALILYNEDANYKNDYLSQFESARGPVDVIFRVEAPGANRVNVAGTFNNWDQNSHPLKNVGNNIWEITLNLEPGAYDYKFLQDGDWDILNEDNRHRVVRRTTENPALFEVKAPNARRVTIAGSFNDWDKDKDLMVKGDDGTWSIELFLSPGSYEYKFVKDGDWDALNVDNRRVNIGRDGRPQESGVLFEVSAPDANKVTIAGSFNDWNENSHELKSDGSGNWSIRLDLNPGTYQYKFLKDGDWDALNVDDRRVNIGQDGSIVDGRTLFEVSAPNASRVTVAGEFNGWNENSHELKSDGSGNWSIKIDIPSGTYEYKFLKDGDWDALNVDNRTITVD